jgi:hypothetical protein
MSSYKWDDRGILHRANQDPLYLKPGDRFFDVSNGRWALCTRIIPREEALGAPFEALYDGCDRFKSFIGSAMACDIGEVIQCR